jgi:hypothetical protein
MLNKVTEMIRVAPGQEWLLGGREWAKRGLELNGAKYLKEFRLESGIPIWRYQLGELVLEKMILMPYRQNTIYIIYRLVEGEGPVRLKLRLGMNIRPHDAPLGAGLPEGGYVLTVFDGRYEIKAPAMPPLRLCLNGARGAFTVESQVFAELEYRVEESRGYEAISDLWSPGIFWRITRKSQVTLVAFENWGTALH